MWTYRRKRCCREAQAAGLKVGAAKADIVTADITHHLLSQIPELAWVGIRLEGTRVVLEVAEREIVLQDQNLPGDVVAAKSGLIEQIIPLVGLPLVKEGDTVVAGQVLISGRPHYYDETGVPHFCRMAYTNGQRESSRPGCGMRLRLTFP